MTTNATMIGPAEDHEEQSEQKARPAIIELQSFNEVRFDSAIALLCIRHAQSISKYEAIKLHVLMDIFRVLDSGNPIIGGKFEPWAGGPVAPEAYSRIDNWCDRYDYTPKIPSSGVLTTKPKAGRVTSIGWISSKRTSKPRILACR